MVFQAASDSGSGFRVLPMRQKFCPEATMLRRGIPSCDIGREKKRKREPLWYNVKPRQEEDCLQFF